MVWPGWLAQVSLLRQLGLESSNALPHWVALASQSMRTGITRRNRHARPRHPQHGPRGTTVLGGIPMPAGTYVHIGIGAANRDPAQFPDPEHLDIRRQPDRHLAFGSGIHACAGMW